MVNINMRVPPELAERIEKAASLGHLDKAEIIRLAIDCGLDEMQRVGFDVRQVYKEAIQQAKQQDAPSSTGPRSMKELAREPDVVRVKKA